MNFFNQRLWLDRATLLISPLLLLALWAWVTHIQVFSPQLLVSPLDVVKTAEEMWQSGELQEHITRSLYRLALGFSIGSVLGIGFGVLMAVSKSVEGYCGPFFQAFRQIPSIALIPMLVLIFGVEETFKIIIVAKATFFTVALATYDGVKGVPRMYFELSDVYRFSPFTLYLRVIFPATVPAVLTGLRIGLSRSWMVLVVAELLAADSGLGQMMEMGRQIFRMDIVMLGVVLTGVIGFSLDRGFKLIESRLLRWRRR